MINAIEKEFVIDEIKIDSKLYCSDNGKMLILFENGKTLLFDQELAADIKDDSWRKSKGIVNKIKRTSMIKESEEVEIMPLFFMIDFTTKCNMNCYYCLRNFEDEGKIISDRELKSIVAYISAYCKKHEIPRIDVQPWGGEPLLALDKILYMKQLFDDNKIDTYVTVQTNGLLLGEDTAKILKEHHINVGISLDGGQDAHDFHRKDMGKHATYDRVTKAVKHAQDTWYEDIGTITVNSRFSLPKIEESIESMVKELHLHTLKFNLMHPNSENFDTNTTIEKEEIPKYIRTIVDKIVELNEQGYQVTDANVRDKILNLLIGNCGDICHGRGCQGGAKFVTITQNGDVYPCELVGVEKIKIGNIYDDIDLIDMITKSKETNEYFKDKEMEVCKACDWKPYCKGGCTASILSYKGEIDGVDEKECAINQVLYPLLIQLILEKPDIIEKMTKGKIKLVEER